MLEKKGINDLHWNYFLALESDLLKLSRYIEFSTDNYNTYSLELAHLLLASASETDVILKQLCKNLDPQSKPINIDLYREVITERLPIICDMIIEIPRFGLQIKPWENWKENKNPDWWRAYNNVKHHRGDFFSQATLQHTIASVAALFIVVLFYYKEKAESGKLIPTAELFVPNVRCYVGAGASVFGNTLMYKLDKLKN